MWRRMADVRTDVSEDRIASIIRVKIISSLILFTLIMEAMPSSETSVLITATWCHIPEGGIINTTPNFATQHLPDSRICTMEFSSSEPWILPILSFGT
jgi:hypothetical protein